MFLCVCFWHVIDQILQVTFLLWRGQVQNPNKSTVETRKNAERVLR